MNWIGGNFPPRFGGGQWYSIDSPPERISLETHIVFSTEHSPEDLQNLMNRRFEPVLEIFDGLKVEKSVALCLTLGQV